MYNEVNEKLTKVFENLPDTGIGVNSGSVVRYEFDAISKVYDGNMMIVTEENRTLSPLLIYGGDVKQHSQVEATDLNITANSASAFIYAHLPM